MKIISHSPAFLHSLRPALTFGIVISALLITSCASLISSQLMGLADNLSLAIMNQDDPETVRDGAPAYLLLMDSLVEGDPENPRILLAAAKLYTAYAAVFVEDNERAKRLSSRAWTYARKSICIDKPKVCQSIDKPFDEFEKSIHEFEKDEVGLLYSLATTWAGWIQAHRDDWSAVADLPKVNACMKQIVQMDAGYDNGGPHQYLGLMNSLVPKTLGGKPQVGEKHFEKAIAISKGKNLMIKVQYAETYARLVFDRSLHDRLLNEVIQADANIPGLVLFNTLAKRKAKQLLGEADDYF